jgi:GT2 family glycosyltransferase
MSAHQIDIVIVNWNSGAQLADCIGSFRAVAHDAVAISRLVIVDNASGDDSLARAVALSDGLPLTVISNSDNKGFAAASNQGAKGSTADFLLFLNPDTLLTAGCLEIPCEFLSRPENAGVGIVGISLVDPDRNVARSCARFPAASSMIAHLVGLDRLFPALFPSHFMREWDHAEIRVVDQVMGAFLLIRRELFFALGGFDERFFVYYEDVDLALRAKARGMTSVFLPAARAFHRGGGTTSSIQGQRLFLFLRSRTLYCLKHFHPVGALMVSVLSIIFEPFARMAGAVLSGKAGEIPGIACAFGRLLVQMPRLLHTHLRLPRQ